MMAEEQLKTMIKNCMVERQQLLPSQDKSKHDAFYAKHYKDNDVLFIRPSGNPLTVKDAKEMHFSGDSAHEMSE
jgi:hypothetical protein